MLEVLLILAIIIVPIMVVGAWINVIRFQIKLHKTPQENTKERQGLNMDLSYYRAKAIVLSLCLGGLVILFSTAMSNM